MEYSAGLQFFLPESYCDEWLHMSARPRQHDFRLASFWKKVAQYSTRGFIVLLLAYAKLPIRRPGCFYDPPFLLVTFASVPICQIMKTTNVLNNVKNMQNLGLQTFLIYNSYILKDLQSQPNRYKVPFILSLSAW